MADKDVKSAVRNNDKAVKLAVVEQLKEITKDQVNTPTDEPAKVTAYKEKSASLLVKDPGPVVPVKPVTHHLQASIM